MTTAINIRFNGESNMGLIHKDIAKLRAEFEMLQKQAIAAAHAQDGNVRGYKNVADGMVGVRENFRLGTAAAGEFSLIQQKLVPQSVAFAESIKQQKVGLTEYIKNRRLMGTVLKEQIALQHASSLAWSVDPSGKISSDLIIPKNLPADLVTTRQKLGLFNSAMSSVAHNTINWGKNTQWAGRQLMTGLTLPIGIAAAAAGKFAYDFDKAITNVVKVYGDANAALQESGDAIRVSAMSTVRAASSIYGQSAADTLNIMADLAAAGKTGNELQQATMLTSRASILGELEWQSAVKATIALQSVYHHNAQEIGDDFNYINAMENQTVLTSQDFVTAIPKVAGVMNALGADLKQVGTLLTAFKASGIDAAEGANALKSINFRLVGTYGKGLETFYKATGQSLRQIIHDTNGETIPSLMRFADAIKDLSAPQKISVTRDVFGIYQGSKALLMLEQLTEGSDQLSRALAVGNNSVAQNAFIAQTELDRLNARPFTQIKKAAQELQITLAEIGEKIVPYVVTAFNMLTDLVKGFSQMDAGKQKFALIVLGLIAIAGPLIMLTGLFANLLGNVGRVSTSLTGLALRFKITDAAERATILQGKLAAQTWDLRTAAVERQTIALSGVANAMNALNTNVKPSVAAQPMKSYGESYQTIKYDADGNAKSSPWYDSTDRPNQNRPVGGRKQSQILKGDVALMDRQAVIAGELERAEYKRQQTLGAQNASIIEQNKLMAGRVRIATSGLMMAGMLGTMITDSNSLMGYLSNIGMMAGMIGMMFQGTVTRIANAFKVMFAAIAVDLQRVFGVQFVGMLGRAKAAVLAFALANKIALGAGLLVVAALYMAWDRVRDNTEKARQAVEDYNSFSKGMATQLGFSYQEVAVGIPGGVQTGKIQANTAAKKFAAENEAAAAAFSAKKGEDIGLIWGQAVAQGASVKIHGGTTEAAMKATRVALSLMGKEFADGEFESKLKVLVDFESATSVTAALNKNVVDASKAAMDEAKTGWEKVWDDTMHFNWEGQATTMTDAGFEAIRKAYKEAIDNGLAAKPEDQAAIFDTLFDSMQAPIEKAFAQAMKMNPELMKKQGLDNIKAFSTFMALDLGPTGRETKRTVLSSLGFDEKSITELSLTNDEIATFIELLRSMPGITIPENLFDLGSIRKSLDATVGARVQFLTLEQAQKKYAYSQEAWVNKTGTNMSAAMQLAALNAARVSMGLEETTHVMDGFGAVTEATVDHVKTLQEAMDDLRLHPAITEDMVIGSWKNIITGTIEDVASAATDSLDREGQAAIDAVKAQGDAALQGIEDRADAADEAAKKVADKQKDRHDKEKDALKEMQDDRKDALEKERDARIDAIDKAIKAEQDAEDIRQKIFEAEKSRIQRLAEMYNKNVDLNMAINSGSMDEAAKIQNDMIATQQGWDVEDTGAASKTGSEKKIDDLEKQKKNIADVKDARLKALDDISKAESDAQAARFKREDDALANVRDAAKKKVDAEKEAQKARNKINEDGAARTVEIQKASFALQLAQLRAVVPTTKAEMDVQINEIDKLYKKYGKEVLGPQGESWGKLVAGSLKHHVIVEAGALKTAVAWSTVGADIAKGLIDGAFGMTPSEFSKWMNGGVAPEGSLMAPPKATRYVGGSIANASSGTKYTSGGSTAHDGGIIGEMGQGSTTGYSRQASLAHSEEMVRTLKGEGILSKKAMGRIGREGFHAINNGLPIGGADLMGLGSVPGAMIAGLTKSLIGQTIGAVVRKRLNVDMGADFTGLGAGSNNAQKVYNTLTSLGFTPQAAAGVIGNLMQESGVNPGSQQQGGPGRGIMQWSEGERWASLKNWAGKKDPWALDTQVQYMLKEMNDYGLTERFKGMKDVNAATLLFEEVMERAGIPNMPARYRHANTAFKQFGSGQQGSTNKTGLFGEGINLPVGAPGGPTQSGSAHERLINFGRALQRMGFTVGENKAFGPVYPVHAPNSWHYRDGAIDVNFDGQGQAHETSKINSILAMAKQYGLRTIWQYPGHYNHAHFDQDTGPDLGNFGTGGDEMAALGKMAGMGTNPVEDIMARGGIGQKILPLRGQISSKYGMRHNPLLGRNTFHDGTDIVAPQGTPIHSLASGRVLFAGVDKAYGNYTVVQHSNGMLSAYGHQSKMNVGAGDIVRAGQVIGNVGSTGASTGPHLHFQTGSANKWFDPNMVMPQLKTGGFTLNDGYARLHKAETVLTAPLSTKLNEGIDRFANGPVTTYTIKADFNGATFATDVDVERAFQSLMDKAEHRNGSNRRVGSR